jgi:hypothetical protein
MVGNAYNPNTWEVEIRVWGQPGSNSKTLSQKKNNKKKTQRKPQSTDTQNK